VVQGLYLGRTDKNVYLASTESCPDAGCRRVLSIPDKDVTCLTFGPSVDVDAVPATDTRLVGFRPNYSPGDPCAGPSRSATPNPPADPDHTSIRILSPFGLNLQGLRERKVATPKLVLETDVLFRFDSAKLTPAANPRLRRVMRAIRASGADQVFVAGHTDSKGSRASNERLADSRAAAVQEALVMLSGSHGLVIRGNGFGERAPVACNMNPDGSDNWIGRAYNRRVEIWTDQAPRYLKPDCPGTAISP
jgi:outer membrane protein OmpA-like peptidoglycan-associated protein